MTARTRARKKRTIVEEEIPEGQNAFDEPTNELDVNLESVLDTEQLHDVLEQFGITEGILYRIYRQVPQGPPSFCYETMDYSETFLQRERGAGMYLVRIFINGKFKKSIAVQVDAPAAGTAPGTAPVTNPADAHSRFLEQMVLQLITNQSANGNHGPSLTELTGSLANLDALRGKQESAMDMFLKGVELAKTMIEAGGGGGGDWKTELLRMGREAIPGITSVVQSRLQTPPANPKPPEQVTMINPDTLTDDQQKAMLQQAITFLKGQFIAGLDPESALNFIIANSGNPQYQTIIKAVLKFSFEDITKLDAEIEQQPFNDCFRVIYDGLRSEFGGEDSVEDDSGRDSGDTTDVRNNGDIGKGGK